MPKSKQNNSVSSQNTMYFASRILQRVSLLLAVTSTIILWASLITVAHGINFINAIQGAEIASPTELNASIVLEIDALKTYAVVFSVVAFVLTLLFLKFTQVRKHEIKLVVDGLVISVFCLIFAVHCETIYRLILERIGS